MSSPKRTRLLELLERIGNLLRSEERSQGAGSGLPPAQIQALAYLARANRYSDTPQAVAEYLGATKGTVSQSLLRLREKGYLLESPDKNDARLVHLSPSAKGRRLLESIRPLEFLDQALENVPKQAGLEQALEDLLRGMQQARGGRAFGVCQGCRHHLVTDTGGTRSGKGTSPSAQCGLTGETLKPAETKLLCREFEC